jgi:hypothetical protein
LFLASIQNSEKSKQFGYADLNKKFLFAKSVSKKHVFGSDGTVSGMGWQTLASWAEVSKYFSLNFSHQFSAMIQSGLRTTYS